MYAINNTFTVQWVGPFHSLDDIWKYKKDEKALDLGLFNFYCYEARKRSNTKWESYIGIHTLNDGIDKRLNKRHEHYSKKENGYKYRNIWIGSFGNKRDQKKNKIDMVETLYIRTYRDILTDNTRKKKSQIPESICVVNLWYNKTDEIRRNRRGTISFMDDVIMYEAENNMVIKGYIPKNKNSVVRLGADVSSIQ